LTLVLFVCGFPFQSEAVLKLARSADSHALAGHLQLLIDPSGEMELADVLAADKAGKFIPLPGFLNLGYTRSASWLRITISRGDDFPNDFFLWLEPPFINQLSVFVQETGRSDLASSYRRLEVGDHTAIKDRPMPHAAMVVPVSVDDDNERRVYIRAQTTSNHGLGGAFVTAERLAVQSLTWALFHGGFIAIALVVALINLIFALHLKDWTYGFYGIYALSLVPGQSAINGLFALLLPGQAHLLNDFFVGSGTGLGFAFFCLFVMQLLNTRDSFRWGHRYLVFIVLLGVVTTATATTVWYGDLARILLLNSYVLVVVVTTLGFIQWRRGLPAAGLYLVAFALTGLGGLISFSRALGLLPVNIFTLNSLEIGTAVHLIWMTLALSMRIRLAEEKLLAVSRDTEQRALQLAEGMVRELAEKQQQLAKALQSEQEIRNNLSVFIDMVCHEYRTPLSVLQTNLDIIKECLRKKLPIEEIRLEKISRAARRLAEVFSTALKNSFLHDTKITLQREPLVLMEYLRDCEKKIKELWGQENFSFSVQIPQNSVVNVDRKLLDTAIFNLVDNAVKYAHPETKIQVSIQQDKSHLHLEISNEVANLASVVGDELFRRFVRGNEASPAGGTGIGLYLVRRIIEQHSGRVTIEETADQHVVARITLPVETVGDQN
jgi:signal transduction histidine kinase